MSIDLRKNGLDLQNIADSATNIDITEIDKK